MSSRSITRAEGRSTRGAESLLGDPGSHRLDEIPARREVREPAVLASEDLASVRHPELRPRLFPEQQRRAAYGIEQAVE